MNTKTKGRNENMSHFCQTLAFQIWIHVVLRHLLKKYLSDDITHAFDTIQNIDAFYKLLCVFISKMFLYIDMYTIVVYISNLSYKWINRLHFDVTYNQFIFFFSDHSYEA